MDQNNLQCVCISPSSSSFPNVRNKCDALKLMVPDENLDCFLKWDKCCSSENNKAFHRSTIMLALKRGYLDRITSPIHRFNTNNKPFTKSYQNALAEKWMMAKSTVKRHQEFRIFMGKLIELKFAEWLSNNKWKIDDLEAWTDKNPDVTATNAIGHKTIFEIKYIGQDDDDFKMVVNSLQGANSASSFSGYAGFNYVLFRIYEAAKQLEKYNTVGSDRKSVAIVIDTMAWPNLKSAFNNCSNHRQLFPESQCGSKWQYFFECTILKKYPCIQKDFQASLANIEILIMKLQDWQLTKLT